MGRVYKAVEGKRARGKAERLEGLPEESVASEEAELGHSREKALTLFASTSPPTTVRG